MLVQLAVANYNELSKWDKFKLFWLPLHIEEDVKGWSWVYYKVYKGRKVEIARERYR